MPIFRRGPRRDPAAAPRDAEFAYLSAAEAGRLRAMVRQAFAEQGLEVSVYAGYAEDDAGRQFGLGNLAALCHSEKRGERAWPELIAEHVVRLLRLVDGPDPLVDMPADQVREQTFVRVVDRSSLPDVSHHRYAREITPTLFEMLALDLPDAVAMFRDSDVDRLGGYELLRACGRANLQMLPIEHHEALRHPDGARLDVVVGDSFFTASRVFVLDTVIEQVTGESPGPDGALVCMPFRHQLAFHVLRDAAVLPSLQAMAGFAELGYAEGVGAVSPYVYWWRPGALEQLSTHDESGELRIQMDAEFGEVLERLMDG